MARDRRNLLKVGAIFTVKNLIGLLKGAVERIITLLKAISTVEWPDFPQNRFNGLKVRFISDIW